MESQRLAKRTKWDLQDNADIVGEKRAWRTETEPNQGPGLRPWVRPSFQRAQWMKSITVCQKEHLIARLLTDNLPVDFLRSDTYQLCEQLLFEPVQSP